MKRYVYLFLVLICVIGSLCVTICHAETKSLAMAENSEDSINTTPYSSDLARLDFDNLAVGTVLTAEDTDYKFVDNIEGVSVNIIYDEDKKSNVAFINHTTGAGGVFGIKAETLEQYFSYRKYGKYPDLIKVEFDIKRTANNAAYASFGPNNGGNFLVFRWLHNPESVQFYDNGVATDSGKTVGVNTWLKVSMYFNFTTGKYRAYLDDEYIAEYTIPTKVTGPSSLIVSGNKAAHVYVDNMCISTLPPFESAKIVDYFDIDGTEKIGYVLNNADTKNAMNYKVFRAKFDKDDVLENVTITTQSIAAGKMELKELENKTASDGGYYKYFVWEGLETLKPLLPGEEDYCYTENDYEILKDKWREFIVGNNINSESEFVTNRIASISAYAKSLQSSMNKNTDATSLWGADYTSTSSLSSEYGKIYFMALAYGTKGHSLYCDESLKTDIMYALDWMYNNRYGQAEIDGTGWKSLRDHDWWHWFVAVPRYLIDTIIILHEEMPQEQIDDYLSPYNYLSTFMCTDFTFESNIKSRAYNMYGACVLQKNDAGINKLINAYKLLFQTTDSGTGMYEDYSYITHNMIPYNGLYGTGALLDRIVQIMSITNNTVFKLPQSYADTYSNWIFNAFEPLMFDAGVMSMVRGRGVDYSTEESCGLIVFESILNMIDTVSDEDAYKLKMMIKRHLKEEQLQYVYKNLSLPNIMKLESIINDSSLPEPLPYELTKIYYNMDRAVTHHEEWSAGLAMSSERIANYESINEDNKNGWYTGDGMLYLYTEPDQYNVDYFKLADPYKRPGTTVDSQLREEVSIAKGQEYFSSKDFVGGASIDDKYAVAAMELESFHNDELKGVVDDGSGGDQPLHECDLTAKKSWFMFDEEIVCLGADINASKDYEVFTTVENRKIDSHDISVNSIAVDDEKEHKIDSPSWAYIEGTGGYYFPSGGNLKYKKVTNNKTFFEMWLTHGNSPTDASYAYAVLPLKTAEETALYSESPKFEILSNTEDIQSVYHKELGISGYVFWKACKFDGITTSAPVIMMKKETETGIEIVFCDPTQKQSNIQITLDGEYQLSDCSQAVTVSVNDEKTIISGDLSKIGGETLKVVIR